VAAGAMRDAYFECVLQFVVACSMFDFNDDDSEG
jgi:hypothetical protein